MKTDTADTLTITPPLSEATNLQGAAFMGLTTYPPGPAGAAAFEADSALVSRFAEAVRLGAPGGVQTIADLGEQRVNSILAEHERARYPELVPVEPGPDPVRRLDEYFRPMQAAHLALRREQDELRAVRTAGTDEALRQIGEANAQRWLGTWGIPTGV